MFNIKNFSYASWKSAAFVAVLICGALLVTGSGSLNYRIFPHFPFGNLIVVALLMSLSYLCLFLSKGFKNLNFLSKIAMGLSILWLPISMTLAGNSNLVFSQKNALFFKTWMIYTLGTSLLIFVLIVFSGFMKWRKTKGNKV